MNIDVKLPSLTEILLAQIPAGEKMALLIILKSRLTRAENFEAVGLVQDLIYQDQIVCEHGFARRINNN